MLLGVCLEAKSRGASEQARQRGQPPTFWPKNNRNNALNSFRSESLYFFSRETVYFVRLDILHSGTKFHGIVTTEYTTDALMILVGSCARCVSSSRFLLISSACLYLPFPVHELSNRVNSFPYASYMQIDSCEVHSISGSSRTQSRSPP